MMKRNLDLVREILIQLENCDYTSGGHHLKVEGYSDDDFNYHIKIMHEGGLIEAQSSQGSKPHNGGQIVYKVWTPKSITWTGHQYLSSIRDKRVWSELKEKYKDRLFDISFDAVKSTAIEIARSLGIGI